jgi:adenylyltransferase/sulfurtransferase
LLVGCGALGTAIAEALVRAGIGRLILVDRDYVELSNLQRQVLFDEQDARERLPKAVAAQRKLAAINPSVTVQAIVGDVHAGNIETLAGLAGTPTSVGVPTKLLLDGTDNFETRYLLNDVSVKHGIPYIYGGVVGTAGTALVILPRSPIDADDYPWEASQAGGATPDLRDLFEQMPAPGSQPTCETVGVLGPAVSVVSAFESAEALKILMSRWHAVCRKMLHIDLWQNRWGLINLSGAAEASNGICSRQRRFEFLEGTSHAGAALTLCGRGAVQVSPTSAVTLDLPTIETRWRAAGLSPRNNGYLLHTPLPKSESASEITLFTDGRAIIKGIDRAEQARSVYARWVGS